MNLKRSLAATVLAASLLATSVVGPVHAAEPPATVVVPTGGGEFQHAFYVADRFAVLESRTRWSTT